MSGFTVCSGQPLILTWPLPVRTKATATAVFLRPKHWTFSAAVVSAIVASKQGSSQLNWWGGEEIVPGQRRALSQ
eukprot:CAMPEP_0115471942 /NCGR_PEP_ID=MMETSP0271-20121206/52787_1 /TAXON_ID=71861 /ORGANISM="Scrippsiella trochoidea, Strain CCMP3099" /LENGTH=74 /DNA_ID=CAMNT_0002899151 /DNA_START=25 /DNA_END=246 /DNA_ORIENTATION=-